MIIIRSSNLFSRPLHRLRSVPTDPSDKSLGYFQLSALRTQWNRLFWAKPTASHADIERTNQNRSKMLLVAILAGGEQAQFFFPRDDAFSFALISHADQWVAATHLDSARSSLRVRRYSITGASSRVRGSRRRCSAVS